MKFFMLRKQKVLESLMERKILKYATFYADPRGHIISCIDKIYT